MSSLQASSVYQMLILSGVVGVVQCAQCYVTTHSKSPFIYRHELTVLQPSMKPHQDTPQHYACSMFVLL